MRILAIDLGGTRLKAGLVSDGAVVEETVVPAPADGSAAALADAFLHAAADRNIDAAALCVPGLVGDDGIVASLPGKHAGIEGQDLPALLRETLGVSRSLVVNDAIAYATGETSAGAGAGAARVVVVTIGTGVGVTVLDRGRPVGSGPLGGGTLGGFIPIGEPDGSLDSNGTAGTIEARCAARRLAEACGARSVEDAYAAIARDEAAARAGLERYRTDLARALVALAHAHAPERIVVGGGPIVPGNPLLPGLEELVTPQLFAGYRVEVRAAVLGDRAALLGLAHLAEVA